ncbi:MAG: aldo/keto reductase [Phycisphaerales bacterium]|nr:aldo/keto reductase [Phycisphaerales bacterium]
MDLKPLGNTGIHVSPIGLGTVKIGRNRGVKYPQPYDLPSDEMVRQLLDTAIDLGVNLIDTAPAYGTSEERLGPMLARDRDRWVIVAKVGEEFVDGESRFDFTPKAVIASVQRSLKRLRTDRLDCVLVHSDGSDEHIVKNLGTLDALAELKARGDIRSFGMSTKTTSGALLAAERCDVLMLTYNPVMTDDAPAIDEAARRNIGVLIKKAFASGHLTEKKGSDPLLSAGDDPVLAVLRFVFRRPGVTSVIAGTINPDHLRHNVEAARSILES